MKVICAGLAKTGTKSITKALRHLGYEVYDWEEQIFYFMDQWIDVFQNGAAPDVKYIYQNADAVVDVPGVFFWEEILEAFPDCKVILSERNEDSWVESWVNQLKALDNTKSVFLKILSPTMRKFSRIGRASVRALYGSRETTPTYVFRKRYRMHNHRVRSLAPPSKLLLYDVKQGWKPLCEFLGCEVPTVAFPHENVKGEIAQKLAKLSLTRIGRQVKWEIQRAMLVVISAIVILAAIIWAFCYNNQNIKFHPFQLPDCKVILSERNEDSWIESWVNQLKALDNTKSVFLKILSPTMRKFSRIGRASVRALYGSRETTPTYVFRKRYRMHNHRVRSLAPPSKLLLYDVKQGWKPLCDFLGCEVPTVAFPHENVKGEIAQKLAKLSSTRIGRQVKWEIQRAMLVVISAIVILAAIIWAFCYN
ncbi:PREDICTED: uncharacterized protein LOC107338332 [Acropora digitifera]|uniref:uncharacterized protein LOC107338332 n=1 Tax=Acropora digitifera TaxID=70779 RepID=UPI00077AB7A8|nr:PREDICTED: uncharacterized protein LOC107338332 [Acropora digitifera]